MKRFPQASHLIDLSCLRSFIAIAQTGSISRAASIVCLSQSAVSLQIKRLEIMLDTKLIIRKSKGIVLTKSGEELVPHAKDILEKNNNIVKQFLNAYKHKQILLGVPHDVVHPSVPLAIRNFKNNNNTDVRIILNSTKNLWNAYERCDLDMIITTDINIKDKSICLARKKLIWVSALNGQCIDKNPLPIIFNTSCIIYEISTSLLVQTGINFQVIENLNDVNELIAGVAADQGVHALIEDKCPSYLIDISSNKRLPSLPDIKINLTYKETSDDDLNELAKCLQAQFKKS